MKQANNNMSNLQLIIGSENLHNFSKSAISKQQSKDLNLIPVFCPLIPKCQPQGNAGPSQMSKQRQYKKYQSK